MDEEFERLRNREGKITAAFFLLFLYGTGEERRRLQSKFLRLVFILKMITLGLWYLAF